MKFIQLNTPANPQNKNLQRIIVVFEAFLAELELHKIPNEIMETINSQLNEINAFNDTEKQLLKKMQKVQSTILTLLEKELQFVCQNHYRNLWMVIGMALFGLPLGIAFGAMLGNMAFLGIGLPIGMVVGLVVGTNMDKKAKNEGRQLNIDILE